MDKKQLQYTFCPISQERQHDKLFSGKITHKMWWRGLTQTCLSIFKDYIRQLVTFKTYTKNVRERRTKCT